MIYVNRVPSVNMALQAGLRLFAYNSSESPSRNGPVLQTFGPVVTEYTRPECRVLVSGRRNVNHFFHLAEAMWMLAGRNDLEFCQKFVKNFGNYSDDNKTLWGAYGHRWKQFFGYDQLEEIIQTLRKDPLSRRCVLGMWNSMMVEDGPEPMDADLHIASAGGKDVPCNTHAYFDTTNGVLNMTVCCRSNDALWGAHGANAVHFSFLLEYVALRVGVPMGVLRQFSNNYHIYTNAAEPFLPSGGDQASRLIAFGEEVARGDVYVDGGGGLHPVPHSRVRHYPLLPSRDSLMFEEELQAFHTDLKELDAITFEGKRPSSEFFIEVYSPMMATWRAFKTGDLLAAEREAFNINAEDWRMGALNFINVRKVKSNDAN